MTRIQTPLTLEYLRSRREEILRVASAHGAQNVRIFGSVARGSADAGSDVDILIDIPGEVGGFAYFGQLADLQRDLSLVLGLDVDVVDSAGLRRLRARILSEAVPL